MKYLPLSLLLAGLAGCGGSPTEQPAAKRPAKTAAQVEQPASEGHTLNVVVLPVDSTLVFPVPAHPEELCAAIQQAWRTYLQQHPQARQQLAFDKDGVEWYAGADLTLDRQGRIRHFKYSDHAQLFARNCVQALGPVLRASRWHPLYRKTRTGPQALVSQVVVYFSLLRDGSFSVAFTDYLHYGYHFFICGKRFHS